MHTTFKKILNGRCLRVPSDADPGSRYETISLFGGGWGMIPGSADSRVWSETEKERLPIKSCVVK